MLQDPGRDDHDGDLDLDTDGLDTDGLDTDGLDTDGLDGPVPGDDCPPLDDAKEQVGYELFDWDPDELDELDDVLHELGLPHEWVSDGYEVVVHEEDEPRVDALLPGIRFPDELPAEADDGDDTDVQVLSDLFVAADRLHAGVNGEAVNAFLDAAEQVGERPPYGVDDRDWEAVCGLVDQLIDLFHAGGPDEQASELAYQLRRRLRPLV